jgi:hypothetical protein
MTIRLVKYLLPVLLCLALGGCPGQNQPTGASPGGTDVTSDNTGGTGDENTGAGGGNEDTNDGGGTGGDQTDGNGTADSGDDATTAEPTGPVALSGRINPSQASKRRPRLQDGDLYPFTVVAQSDATGEVFRGETAVDGEFNIDIPDDEVGSSFMVTILGPDGRAVGPVVLDAAGDEGTTGLALDRAADLGTIELPDDPTQTPIVPGADSDVADLLDPSITARLNADGAPVGLASVGKGDEADASGSPSGALVDADSDGLIDMLDADDDGDGTVDDFDTSGPAPATPADAHVNFFMNLKIGTDFAPTYYTGTTAQIAERLSYDTVITLEVMTEPSATRAITAAQMLETPGPAYLPIAQKTGEGAVGALWVDTDYAFDSLGDRWGVWIRPNAVMDAGDTFTLDVSFDDDTTEQYSRMINYVFKNIPKLIEYGSAGSLTAFDLDGGGADGTPARPLTFDGTQDLVLIFNPPPDETGAPITGMNYSFQLSYYRTDGSAVSGGDINWTATCPTPIADFDRGTYLVHVADLGALSAEETYTVTLPKEIFADTVTLNSSSDVAIGSYKIDLTAEAPTGNAAIMLTYAKQ